MSARTRRSSALTVQGWLNVVLCTMGAVVLAGGMAGAVLLARSDRVSADLVDRVQPARVAAYQLQAALRDQETAVRGYLITADGRFLTPYVGGRDAEQSASARVRDLLAGRSDLLADLDAVEGAAGRWRDRYAEPAIVAVRSGSGAPAAEAGRAQFDVLRARFDAQNDHLAGARADGLAQLDAARAWRDRVLVATIAAFVVTGLLLALVVRRTVTRPLSALAESCRHITGGRFEEKIVPHGPRDIRAIGTAVDDMRQRIVEELRASGTARAQLAEQAAALDEQAAELRRSNAELEQFAYVASHDLQEPLRKVASFCQLLEKRYGDQFDERGTQYLTFAVDGAKRMQRLINDLLTFSRVGRLGTRHSDVDLDAALDAALANLGSALEESHAVVERPAVLPTVPGDATLLTMLWQNLIGNAVKFRRAGAEPRIVVDCVPGTGDCDGQWSITLSDNGIGIGVEFVDKVFVIFQRLHGRDVYSGTGIGLALVKKIVEHHGGAIWIDTGYQAGTRFCFTLPAAAVPGPAVPGPAAAELEGAPT